MKLTIVTHSLLSLSLGLSLMACSSSDDEASSELEVSEAQAAGPEDAVQGEEDGIQEMEIEAGAAEDELVTGGDTTADEMEILGLGDDSADADTTTLDETSALTAALQSVEVEAPIAPATGASNDFAGGSSSVSAAAATSQTTGRVLRYVSASEAKMFAEPKRTAKVVTTLKKGDRVIVTVEGEWSKVHQGMYLRSDKLSAKAVAKVRRKAVWAAPAH